jgi:hypothetical protein
MEMEELHCKDVFGKSDCFEGDGLSISLPSHDPFVPERKIYKDDEDGRLRMQCHLLIALDDIHCHEGEPQSFKPFLELPLNV